MNNGAGKRIVERKKEFLEMWHNGVSSSEMGYHFSCNDSTINIYAKRFGLERRSLLGNYKKHFEEISDDEIRRRCEEVQAGWDEQTEWNRRVCKNQPVVCKHMVTRRDHFDETEPAPIEGVGAPEFNKQMDAAGHKRPAYSVFEN